jgi:hypothetical protein
MRHGCRPYVTHACERQNPREALPLGTEPSYIRLDFILFDSQRHSIDYGHRRGATQKRARNFSDITFSAKSTLGRFELLSACS